VLVDLLSSQVLCTSSVFRPSDGCRTRQILPSLYLRPSSSRLPPFLDYLQYSHRLPDHPSAEEPYPRMMSNEMSLQQCASGQAKSHLVMALFNSFVLPYAFPSWVANGYNKHSSELALGIMVRVLAMYARRSIS